MTHLLTFTGPARSAARLLIRDTSLQGYLDRTTEDNGLTLSIDPAKFPGYRPSRGEESLLTVLYALSGRTSTINLAELAANVDAQTRAVVLTALAQAWQVAVPGQRAGAVA